MLSGGILNVKRRYIKCNVLLTTKKEAVDAWLKGKSNRDNGSSGGSIVPEFMLE
jgi:hypothetical protein